MENRLNYSWLIPCNVNLYNPFDAFEKLEYIDWRQSCQVSAGDVVYIYCGKPYKKIMFKTIVIKANIQPEDTDRSDRPFYKNGLNEIGNRPRFGYMRLKLVKSIDREELALDVLCNNGMNSAPQGPRRITGGLLAYVEDKI